MKKEICLTVNFDETIYEVDTKDDDYFEFCLLNDLLKIKPTDIVDIEVEKGKPKYDDSDEKLYIDLVLKNEPEYYLGKNGKGIPD